MMAQEPGWFKNNHGSRTMMAQEPYTVVQNNDGSMFSKLQAISKHSAIKVKQNASSRSMGLPSSIRATANPLIQSMDLAGETKKQPFWQHGGTILVDSQAATIKGHCYMWLNWLPILHRHTSCGSPIMHGCTNSRLQLFEGTAEPYQIRATLKDPVLNAKEYTQQAMLAHCCPARLQQNLGPL